MIWMEADEQLYARSETVDSQCFGKKKIQNTQEVKENAF